MSEYQLGIQSLLQAPTGLDYANQELANQQAIQNLLFNKQANELNKQAVALQQKQLDAGLAKNALFLEAQKEYARNPTRENLAKLIAMGGTGADQAKLYETRSEEENRLIVADAGRTLADAQSGNFKAIYTRAKNVLETAPKDSEAYKDAYELQRLAFGAMLGNDDDANNLVFTSNAVINAYGGDAQAKQASMLPTELAKGQSEISLAQQNADANMLTAQAAMTSANVKQQEANQGKYNTVDANGRYIMYDEKTGNYIYLDDNSIVPEANIQNTGVSFGGSGNTASFNDYLNPLLKKESGGDPNIPNPFSTATGRGQFLEKTLDWMYNLHYKDSMSKKQFLDAYKNNVNGFQDTVILDYTKDNAKYLASKGIPATKLTLYSTHRFGAEGGRKFIEANPNTPIDKLVGDIGMKQNPDFWTGNKIGKGKPKTVGEITKEFVSEGFTNDIVDLGESYPIKDVRTNNEKVSDQNTKANKLATSNNRYDNMAANVLSGSIEFKSLDPKDQAQVGRRLTKEDIEYGRQVYAFNHQTDIQQRYLASVREYSNAAAQHLQTHQELYGDKPEDSLLHLAGVNNPVISYFVGKQFGSDSEAKKELLRTTSDNAGNAGAKVTGTMGAEPGQAQIKKAGFGETKQYKAKVNSAKHILDSAYSNTHSGLYLYNPNNYQTYYETMEPDTRKNIAYIGSEYIRINKDNKKALPNSRDIAELQSGKMLPYQFAKKYGNTLTITYLYKPN